MRFHWFAAAIVLGAATPSMADYNRIGTVDFRFQTPTEQTFRGFGGPVGSLNFVAVHGDVFCEKIGISYADGRVDNITSYRLLERGKGLHYEVPDGTRGLDHLFFNCRGNDRGAYIEIGADNGRARDGWRPNHGGDWGSPPPRDDRFRDGPPPPRDDRFRDGPPPPRPDWRRPPFDRGPGPDGWITIDRLSFEGNNDVENSFTGWRGRHIDRMALRAVNATARCNRVTASFRDGGSVMLAKDRKLNLGETVVFDLPGGTRNLDTIYMRCHAFGDGQVTIEVLGQK